MYGIVLIAALIVTGGAIAVIGDRVGSRVGKKKLSLFRYVNQGQFMILIVAATRRRGRNIRAVYPNLYQNFVCFFLY